jgi:hypothetical protein
VSWEWVFGKRNFCFGGGGEVVIFSRDANRTAVETNFDEPDGCDVQQNSHITGPMSHDANHNAIKTNVQPAHDKR